MVQFSEFLKIFCQLENELENLTSFAQKADFREIHKYLEPWHDAYQMQGNCQLINLNTKQNDFV